MNRTTVAELESQRLAMQHALDGQLSTTSRNRMGQFATPPRLAIEIQRYARQQFDTNEKVRFIDPAIGSGAFYSALLSAFPKAQIDTSVGYEIDPHYGIPASRLWNETGLDMRLEDFTKADTPEQADRFNLLICNPPYVRHHYIETEAKQRLKMNARHAVGVEINGLAGLYCYFLVLSHGWMTENGLAGWLIPSEFMDVNYGVCLKRYLLDKVTLLHIHRFDPNDVQFSDALVSSSVVWFRNKPPERETEVRFTFGGTLERPRLERLVPLKALHHDQKWTRLPTKQSDGIANGPVLGDYFRIKRGIATGSNKYFILSKQEIDSRGLPMEAFKPILPSPRYVPDDEIASDIEGNPVLEQRLFLLDPPWTEGEMRESYPRLWAYLQQGEENGVEDRYICRHRSRWYAQEQRPPAPFVCTYLGRSNKKNGKPFRFILNNSKATSANVYLMLYPREPLKRAMSIKPALKRHVWKYLNDICPQSMLDEGRVYGGGLYKLEPKELQRVPAEALAELVPTSKQLVPR